MKSFISSDLKSNCKSWLNHCSHKQIFQNPQNDMLDFFLNGENDLSDSVV